MDETYDDLMRELERLRKEKRTREARRRPWLRTAKLFAIGLALIFVSTAALAAVVLFAHTFPTTGNGTQGVLTTTCSTLLFNPPSSSIIGTAGTVLYECALPSTSATALTVSTPGSADPGFTLPTNAGTVSLSLVTHSGTAVSCSGGTVLSSGTSVSFTLGQSWDYCLSYTSYPSAGISSFQVTWSQ